MTAGTGCAVATAGCSRPDDHPVVHKVAVVAAVAVGAAALVGLSGWVSALVLVGTLGAGYGLYRARVRRNAVPEFFGGAGEETRLTELKPASPSELPPDRDGKT